MIAKFLRTELVRLFIVCVTLVHVASCKSVSTIMFHRASCHRSATVRTIEIVPGRAGFC